MTTERGFTLIELLVSMTLLGLLFVLLLGGLRFGTRAWERNSADSDSRSSVFAVQDLLRRDIERACPRLLANPADPQHATIQFDGTAQAIRFFGPAPAGAGGAPCAPLLLGVAPDGRQQRLVLRIGSGVNVYSSDLLRRVQQVSFAYLGSSGGWQKTWRGRATLPVRVRVDVTFSPSDARAWPELFAEPRISAEADCTYDASTKSCRGS
jgi:general secretion pathway protein J